MTVRLVKLGGSDFIAEPLPSADLNDTLDEMIDVAKEDNSDGIFSGCEVRENNAGADMSVDIQAGVVVIAGEKVTIAAQNIAVDAADGANPRIDLFMAGANGTVDVVKGTAAATPLVPAWTASHVQLGKVYVAAADATIVDEDIIQSRQLYTSSMVKRFEVLVDATNQPISTQNNSGGVIFGFPAGTFKNWFKIGVYAEGSHADSEMNVRFSDQNRANNTDIPILANIQVIPTFIQCFWYEDTSDGTNDRVDMFYQEWASGITTFQRNSSASYDMSNQIIHIQITFQGADTTTLHKLWIEGY